MSRVSVKISVMVSVRVKLRLCRVMVSQNQR